MYYTLRMNLFQCVQQLKHNTLQQTYAVDLDLRVRVAVGFVVFLHAVCIRVMRVTRLDRAGINWRTALYLTQIIVHCRLLISSSEKL